MTGWLQFDAFRVHRGSRRRFSGRDLVGLTACNFIDPLHGASIEVVAVQPVFSRSRVFFEARLIQRSIPGGFR